MIKLGLKTRKNARKKKAAKAERHRQSFHVTLVEVNSIIWKQLQFESWNLGRICFLKVELSTSIPLGYLPHLNQG